MFFPSYVFAQKSIYEMTNNDRAFFEKEYSIKNQKLGAMFAGQVFSCGTRSEKWADYTLKYLTNAAKTKILAGNTFLMRNGYNKMSEQTEISIIKKANNDIYSSFNMGKVSIISQRDCSDAIMIANMLDMKSGYIP